MTHSIQDFLESHGYQLIERETENYYYKAGTRIYPKDWQGLSVEDFEKKAVEKGWVEDPLPYVRIGKVITGKANFPAIERLKDLSVLHWQRESDRAKNDDEDQIDALLDSLLEPFFVLEKDEPSD